MVSQISVGEILTIITASATALVTVVNAIGTYWGRKVRAAKVDAGHQDLVTKADAAATKLTEIKTLANGTLAALQLQLADALARIALLEQEKRDQALAPRGRRVTDPVAP